MSSLTQAQQKNPDPGRWKRRRRFIINVAGGLLLCAAAALLFMLFYVNSPEMQDVYNYVQQEMRIVQEVVEGYIFDIKNIWLVMLALLFIYFLNALVPFLPLPVLCLVSAATLPLYFSFTVNILGVAVRVSSTYLWGKRLGGGSVHKLVSRFDYINGVLERDGRGNPWLLFLFRLVPSFPINSVSRIYGALGFDYIDYLLISVLGFLPKLIMYVFVGAHAFKPFSGSFLVPLIIVFTLSGLSVIGMNMILTAHEKKSKAQEAEDEVASVLFKE
ncbi:MAG: VTT domain-containing protein [Oscillospiraceae bacterium]|jgi:uncharacterized membrane protein YdjX (TVP38/TMEM64 family)|nr:VTT domain-containing protein [Oscillospiraceae bacterium]